MLDDAAVEDDGDVIGDGMHEGEVVRDEEQTQPALAAQFVEQLDDHRLDRDVE